jgi:adenosylhomocysteine nucleosidase
VKTGIIVALPEELSTLTIKKIYRGEYAYIADNILVAYSGAGPDNASKAARLLLRQGCKQLISWGCAGALDNSLKPGDLNIPEILIAENKQQYATDAAWHRRVINVLENYCPILSAPLCESRKIISSSENKITLNKQNASIAIDMESVAIAKIAAAAAIPFLAIRAIADPADMDLPRAVVFALNNEGEIEIKKLLFFLICHPLDIPGLIKLGMHFNTAKNKLKLIARHLPAIIASNPTNNPA